jgi:hypothetical protein
LVSKFAVCEKNLAKLMTYVEAASEKILFKVLRGEFRWVSPVKSKLNEY